jgi:hypothetical protein
VAVGVGVNVAVAVGVGLGGIVAVAVALGSTVAVGVNVAVAVGVAVGVAVAVKVGVGVGVGVAETDLALLIATISASVSGVFQIAACWMLPFSNAPPPDMITRISVVLFKPVLPVVRATICDPTFTPSLKNVNASPLRLKVQLCQVPPGSVGPCMEQSEVEEFPLANPSDCIEGPALRRAALLLVDAEFDMQKAFPPPETGSAFTNAKNVKFWLSIVVPITLSFRFAYPVTPSVRKQVPFSPAPPKK